MRKSAAVVACIALILVECTRAEPSLLPLGYGPLAQAERESETSAERGSRLTPRAAHSGSSTGTNRPERATAPPPTVALSTHPLEAVDAGAKADVAAPTAPTASAARVSVADEARPKLEDWLGLYRGSDTTTFKTTGQAERRFDDPKAKIRVERGKATRLDFVLVDSSTDQDMCALSALVEGDTATIEPGQSCFLENEDEMTVKSRPGKAVHKDKRLTLDLVFDTLTMSDEAPITGTIDYHFDGQR